MSAFPLKADIRVWPYLRPFLLYSYHQMNYSKGLVHMFRMLSFLFCLLMISSNVFANESNWNEATGIEAFQACYDSTAITKVIEECNYTKACINSSRDNSTTIGMIECVRKGYSIWDEKLNLEYKILISLVGKIYGEDAKIALRDSQRAWIKYRDIDCEAAYLRQDLKRTSAKTDCAIRHTALRTMEFKSDIAFYIGRGYETSE